MSVALASVSWTPGFRIIPTRYPAISLFDRIAAPEDFEALYALESMTNDRLRDEVGDIALVPPDERVFGPGTTPIMAAFTHLHPEGSRFSDGSYGVFYAAEGRDTAMAETKYHHGKFLAATHQRPTRLQMRLYSVLIKADLHDLRLSTDAQLYSETSYAQGQALAKKLRTNGSAGVVYRSVRRQGGECVGLFKPRGASACNHASYLEYEWDGKDFSGVLERLE
jgi:hypothetical protein